MKPNEASEPTGVVAPLAVVALDAFVKGALYLGVVLSVGAGAFRHVVAPGLAADARRPLRAAALTGGVLLVVFSAANVLLVLRGTLGYLEPGIVIEYARASLHGRATQARSVLALILVATAFLPRRVWVGALWALATAGLLYSIAAVSHAAGMPGRLPVLADWLHLAAAATWSGSVAAVAFLPIWSEPSRSGLERAMRRVSRVGLAGVTVSLVTGVYAGQLHVWEASSLLSTRYGWTLLAKVGLVAAIVAIAALNRWRLLPALTRDGPTRSLRRALRLEALLLLVVLGATGLLTTSPVPH